MDEQSRNFLVALSKTSTQRDDEDVNIIYYNIRRLGIFENLNDAPLRAICRTARYEHHPANFILFRQGQVATCWFILLSGSVFIDNQMFLPYSCFGKRSGLNYRRSNDCIVLQHSEMIVVDYPDVKHIHVSHQSTVPSTASHASSATHADISEMRKSIHSMSLDPVPLYNNKTTANNITSTTLSPSSAMRAPSPRKISYPQSHAKTLSEAQAQMKAQTQGSKTYSNSIQCTSNVQKGSQNIPPLPVPPSSRNAVDMSSSSSAGTGSSAVPSTSSQLSVSSRYHNYDNFMNRERDSSRNDCEATVQTHKSQVYLNGLNSAEDATFVRVKHRGRSHKSNSINGGVINMNINVGNQKQRTRVPSTASSSTNDDDLRGLPETAVDSEDEDDESCPSHDSFHELKDCVRECLEKEPSERSADDLAILLDFMQHMSALATLPLSIKRELCMKMVFAIVPDAGTIVMENNEKIDAWSVIVNGQVEVRRPDGQRFEYKLGDCFGAKPVNTVQYHVGEMRTLVDDCEFVLVEHQDYCRIMSRVSEHIHKHSDNITGEIVCETETRSVGSQVGQVLIKGNKEKLIEHLIDERDCGVDVNYADDFLLMHRVFIHDPTMIFEKLMHWFAEATLRDRVARIVLLWANNHFNDFECNTEMMNLLERFEHALERDQMFSQQSLLNIACSVKSRSRTITYTRSSRDQPLCLSIIGNNESIFISDVQRNSQSDKLGLKRGDQILEVNGQSFKWMSVARALEVLLSSTHLSITVKSNLLAFKEIIACNDRPVDVSPFTSNLINNTTSIPIQQQQHGRGGAGKLHQKAGSQSNNSSNNRSLTSTIMSSTSNMMQSVGLTSRSSIGASLVSTANPKVSVMDKLLAILKGNTAEDIIDSTTNRELVRGTNPLRASRSNPDISEHNVLMPASLSNNISQYYQPAQAICPEHVLKVYRADQSFKYLTVYKETTAQNVVQLALQEFGMFSEGCSLEWALCETSVTQEGVIKQRRLPDQMCNLAERIQLNSRYYLKNNSRSDPLVPDDLAPEILKEAETQLSQLNAQVLAAQLTLQDFAVFSSIEPTEYVDNLFRLESRYGWPKLSEFETLFNKEMWWVPSEICREKSVQKRAKLVKKLIKVARHCRDFRNFNSMFAIMSGLEKPAVRRLHHTWERVPNKYVKVFEDLQQLVDPSRNMSKYRQHLCEVSHEPPVVPMYPVLKKDLTFTHEGNPTYCGKLVNFEKLRMIARAIRTVTRLCSVPYEIEVMSQQSGGVLNDALLHMNNFDGANGAVATMRKVGANAVKSASQPRKKVYEQALMVRKVKSYLQQLQVVDDEHLLDRMSAECEPQQITSSVQQIRRRIPSPSPSSLSSLSNNSEQQRKLMNNTPKFGVESPQAVQKILSLAQNTRLKYHHHNQAANSNSNKDSTTTMTSLTPSSSPLLPSKAGHSAIRIRNTSNNTHLQRTPSLNYTRQTLPSANMITTDSIQPVDLNAESSSVTNLYSSFTSGTFHYNSSNRFLSSCHCAHCGSNAAKHARKRPSSVPHYATSQPQLHLLFGSSLRANSFNMILKG